jgi:putative copper export protein
VRWASFVALLALVGVAAFRWLVLPGATRIAEAHARGPALRELRPSLARRAAGLGTLAGAALLLAALARLYVESYAMHGAADAMNMGMMGEMVTRTTWGTAWLVQTAAAVVALVAFAFALGSGASAAWAIATAAVLVLAFTPALGGHAAASSRLPALAVLLDGLHVVGAGGWLGALLALATVAIPAVLATATPERGGLVADFVNAFSPTALGFATLVVLTGLFAAWLHLGSVGALWSSAYGRTLLIKLAVLVPVLGTGAYNWLRVRPALGDVAAAGRLRRSAAVELATGLLVIAVTAVLVALQPPA